MYYTWCTEKRGKKSLVAWNDLFGIKVKYQRYTWRSLPRACRSFKRIGEIAEDLAARQGERGSERERKRTRSRGLTCSTFSSRIYLRVLHTRVRRCRRKAGIIQCKQREAETLENTTPRATLESKSICASKLHKRRQLFSQTTQGADLRANRNKGCNSGSAC